MSDGSPTEARARRTRVSARGVARLTLAVLLVVGPVAGISVALDLFAGRSSRQGARCALDGIRGATDDPEAASAALEVADAELEDARRRSGRLTWSLARVAPFAGPSIEVTREVVEVASSAVDLASIVVTDGRELLVDGVDVAVVDGRIDLAPLGRTQALMGALPVERLEAARDALATPRDRWMPGLIRNGRADTLELADETLGTVVSARALTDALPDFLGASGPRRYFVGFQSSAELRGTGGLIGFWGVLGVDDGQLRFGQSEVYDPFDDGEAPTGDARVQRINSIGLAYENPPDVDPEYLGRYATSAGARSFPNINLDPDLPTTSKAILDLYELQTGDRLDGVVLLDPPGMQVLLEATGTTLPIGDELSRTLDVDGGLPTDRFAEIVTADIYETLGFARSDERNQALRAIGDAAFLQVLGGGWDGTEMLRAIVDAASQKHLQVMAEDPKVQAAFAEVGVTGALELPVDADLFAVVANNVVGGKQDVHLGHEFDLDVRLGDVRRSEDETLSAAREVMLGVTVDNPLPTSGMDEYVIGSCYVPGRDYQCFDGEVGSNRTWFSLWTSPETDVVDFRSDDGTAPGAYGKTYRGLRVVDHLHNTSSRQRASFAYEAEGRVPVVRGIDSLVYEFAWWRQAKATPDLLDVRVHPPEGWRIDRVELVGGGGGRGSGVHGAGVELEATLVDQVAHLFGTVTADTALRVHLVGGPT